MIFLRESERNKGVKLLLKIFENIINHPTQTEKYGNLNLIKITNKLSGCKPAMKLLLLSGFEAKENNKRLIWTNTANNMMILKHLQNTLESMTETISITQDETSKQTQSTSHQQTQQNITQMITNLIVNQSPVKKRSFTSYADL